MTSLYFLIRVAFDFRSYLSGLTSNEVSTYGHEYNDFYRCNIKWLPGIDLNAGFLRD